MSLNNYSEAQLKEMAMIEIAYELLNATSNNPKNYHSLLKEVAELKGMTEEEMNNRIAHLYTEMSMDGRFVNVGENQWGLRAWYPFDQTEEELSQANKTRTKKKRKADDEEEDDNFDDEEDFDEFEDLEDELDELANEEDDEFDKDDDDDEDIEEDFDDEFEEEQDDDKDLL